jgi:vacuolar protein sorting-associated protein 45
MVYSMNDILSKEVYLVESLDGKHEGLGHMKAVCLIRPSADNIRLLVSQLKEPKFLEYHIFFTNIVSQELLRRIADADHLAVVKQVQEFYGDYYAIGGDLFSINLNGSLSLSRPKSSYTSHEELSLKRTTHGLLSVLLSLKMKPYVRYLASSDVSASLARDIAGTIGGERDLFTFQRSGGAPLLLILDRREDPVTPLLTQWTYRAMIHELLPGGIKNNTVDLRHVKGVNQDLEQVVVSPSQDTFFRDNMLSNYGDLSNAVQILLQKYTAKRGASNVTSIEDMQRFVDLYPELKAQGLVVGKHVALLTEIAASIETKKLYEISEVEQNVSCAPEAANDHFIAVADAIRLPGVDPLDALRLFMLYALRYEKSRPEKIGELKRVLLESIDLRDNIKLVDSLLEYAGSSQRSNGNELYSASGGSSMLSKLSSKVQRNLQGVDNVLTQHSPLLVNLLDQLAKNKLSKQMYPFVGAEPPPGKLGTVLVFVIGGVTFEEAAKVAAINNGTLPIGVATTSSGATGGAGVAPFRVILGGTTVLNSKSFLAELTRMQSGGSMESGAGSGLP